MTEFVLPELGENVSGGDVLRVLVKPGDTVARDQAVLELETDKATIEVPSSVAGRVAAIRIKEGQKVKVGDVVLELEGEASAPAPRSEAPAAPVADVPASEPEPVMATEQGDAADQDEPGPGAEAAEEEPEAEPQAAVPSGPIEFTLPSLGENVSGGDILRIMVKVGDTVARDQALIELETDKATIEVPSTVAGRIAEVRVREGEKVKVGDTVFVIDAVGAAPAASPITVQRVHAAAAAPKPLAPEDVAPTGGLQQHVAGTRRPSTIDKPGMLEDALEEQQAEAAARPPRGAVLAMPPRDEAPRRPAPAAPSVRRIARELGVDVNQVAGTGPGGRISTDDVKMYVKRLMSSGGPRPADVARAPGVVVDLPDFAKWGAIERKGMRPIRRKTAENLARAWATIPHVTQCDKADITELEALRERFAKKAEAAGGKLTVTAILLKVVAAALKQFPQFNASVDMAAEEIIYKKYVNVGVAVDTERGLLVPVVRDADTKGIVQLSKELAELAEKARTGKVSLEEMQGGTFTITNLGGIGGTYFTPIVNHPEVAILGVSRGGREPVWKGDRFEPRLMLPLSLSYDHRVIDGADGIRFLRWIVEALEQPFVLSLF